MVAEQQYNNWGAPDFERYHSGKMPEAEMHALEKAALDDPFLEDALEGYAYTKTPVADIAELKEKLWPQEEDIKTPVVWYRQKAISQLFKAAAVIVIFGGLGWLIFNNTRKEEQVAVASKEKASPVTADSIPSSLYDVNDSAVFIAKLDDKELNAIDEQKRVSTLDAPAPNPALKDISNSIPFEKDEMARNQSRAADKRSFTLTPSTAASAPVVENARDDRAAAKAAKSTAKQDSSGYRNYFNNANQANSQVRGRVVDNTGKPVPFASIRSNADGRLAVAADADGNFVLNSEVANNNNVQVEVNAAGYEQASTYLNNNTSGNTIVLNQSQNAMSEVLVSGYDKRKVKKESYQWNGRNTLIRLRNAEPLEGWDYFYYVMNDSISGNKILKQQRGRIILQFDTDTGGAVKNVIVVKSLNDSADNVAIRLLYKSPVLKVKNNKTKGEATIKIGL